MRTAREVAHGIVCERQDSEWCHWTTDRTVHAHYCDSLTAAIEARDAELLTVARDALNAEMAKVRESLEDVKQIGNAAIKAAHAERDRLRAALEELRAAVRMHDCRGSHKMRLIIDRALNPEPTT